MKYRYLLNGIFITLISYSCISISIVKPLAKFNNCEDFLVGNNDKWKKDHAGNCGIRTSIVAQLNSTNCNLKGWTYSKVKSILGSPNNETVNYDHSYLRFNKDYVVSSEISTDNEYTEILRVIIDSNQIVQESFSKKISVEQKTG